MNLGRQCTPGDTVIHIAVGSALVLLPVLAFSTAVRAQDTCQGPAHAVEVEMRNVVYHFSDKLSVHIRALQGHLVPTKGNLPIFDDKGSFVLNITSAEIVMAPNSLSAVLNSYVFSKPDSPLKGISVQIESGRLKIKGRLHRKGEIPFETEGQLSASADGKIQLHADKVKALHLPVKGLMDLLGVEIADFIKTGHVQGVEAKKDDLILDPAKLLPPPHIAGQVTAVRLEKDSIVQVFGHPFPSKDMHIPFTNYMAYRCNQLRFGKLTMSNTDMLLIDMDPSDPFDFYLDHYREQLVAGYTKETATFGLRVFMRDYNKVRRGRSEPRRSSTSNTQ